MKPRGYLTYFLALLMALAPLHCLAHAGDCAAHFADLLVLTDQGETLPANDEPAPCDNESGCICKGALVVDYVDAAPLASQFVESLATVDLTPSQCIVCEMPQDWAYLASAHRATSLSGKILRAHLSSYLI